MMNGETSDCQSKTQMTMRMMIRDFHGGLHCSFTFSSSYHRVLDLHVCHRGRGANGRIRGGIVVDLDEDPSL